MESIAIFPPQLLTASKAEKLEYFDEQVIVDHPSLNQAMNACDEKANSVLDRSLNLLVGPTGVGKSAVLKRLVARRNLRRQGEIENRPEVVAAIFIEAEAPDRGAYEFSTLYRDGLVEMKAALIDRTVPLIDRKTRESTLLTLAIESSGRRVGRDGLKLRFKRELIAREVELVAIDEAINIFTTGKSKTANDRVDVLKNQANKLKTFTNKTPTSIILAGAFDFFHLTLTSGQNARRSVITVMEPYPLNKDGLTGFGTALFGLIAHLPVEHSLVAESIASELYLQTLGCVGILKSILCEALVLALNREVILSIVLVRSCYYSTAQLAVMRDEMNAGLKAVHELTSLEDMAGQAEVDSAEQSSRNSVAQVPLKPGETKPSHRTEATEKW
jgi:hypothetical protein